MQRFRTLVQGAWIVLGLGALAMPVLASDPDSSFADDRVLVTLTAKAAANAVLSEHGLPLGVAGLEPACARLGIRGGHRLLRDRGVLHRAPARLSEIGLDRVFVLELTRPDAQAIPELVRELAREPWVERAQPAWLYEPLATYPNDPEFPDQWAHENTGQQGGIPGADIDTPLAWDFTVGHPSTVIAVIDTGADLDHPDLWANLLPGTDITESLIGTNDIHGHGTHVTGLAAARGNNARGIAGVCWSCSVLPVKVFAPGFFTTSEVLAEAIVTAADHGARVINLSLGGNAWDPTPMLAVDYAATLGALSIAASGNSDEYTALTPSAFPNVVCVSGTTPSDTRYGSWGEHNDIAAPTFVISTEVGGGYGQFRGTSASAPHVSGVAGLLLTRDPSLHVQEVRQLLLMGAEDEIGPSVEDTPGWDPRFGFGRLNAHRSLLKIDGPWLALDRAHYLCEDTLYVDVKDRAAGGLVEVGIEGGTCGDEETMSAAPVTSGGYYRGSMSIVPAGPGCTGATPGDGKLSVIHGEILRAERGPLTASAVLDCLKHVCLDSPVLPPQSGDCDNDGALDPGETWAFSAAVDNFQTEVLHDVRADLETSHPQVQLLGIPASVGDVTPSSFPVQPQVTFDLRLPPGAAALGPAELHLTLSGHGFVADEAFCVDEGQDSQLFEIPTHRDGVGPDTWEAFAPAGFAGSVTACPTSIDLSWRSVAGAESYSVYRSELSCGDAASSTIPHGISATPAFVDEAVAVDVQYFYAIEASEAGTQCVTERTCIPSACGCPIPFDPVALRLGREGNDVQLTWDDPQHPGLMWNVYRSDDPDPAAWGDPLFVDVTDEDGGAADIQLTDPGVLAESSALHYLVTAKNGCAESPLVGGR